MVPSTLDHPQEDCDSPKYVWYHVELADCETKLHFIFLLLATCLLLQTLSLFGVKSTGIILLAVNLNQAFVKQTTFYVGYIGWWVVATHLVQQGICH